MCSWGMLEVCEQASHTQKVHIAHSTQRSSVSLSNFRLHVGKQHSSLLLGCFVESRKLIEGMANAVLMFLLLLLPSFPFFVGCLKTLATQFGHNIVLFERPRFHDNDCKCIWYSAMYGWSGD